VLYRIVEEGIPDSLLPFFFGVVESCLEAGAQCQCRPQYEKKVSHSSCCFGFIIKKADPKSVEPALVLPESFFISCPERLRRTDKRLRRHHILRTCQGR
jgi:hypothetical protein